MLSTGRSHRSSTDSEVVRWGSDFARAAAVVVNAGRQEEVEVVVHARGSSSSARKRVRVNGVNRRASALSPVLRSVLFAPEDMLLIVGSPSLRRALLDGIVVQREPTAMAVMSTYQRTLTQRNSLLRRIREEQAGDDELSYWTGLIVEHGARILDWRREALEAMAAPLAAAHREIAPDEPALTLRYVSNVQLAAGESHEDALRRRLRETADKEVWNGATLVGPHRDDASVHLRRATTHGVRIQGPAAHGHPGAEAGRTRCARRPRRPTTAAPARRRLQRARSTAPRSPGASHRRSAAGDRDDHHPRRPRPGARRRVHGLAGGARIRPAGARVSER